MRVNITNESNSQQTSNTNNENISSENQELPITREILQTVWERMRQMGGNERNLLIRHLSHSNNPEIISNSESSRERAIRSFIFSRRRNVSPIQAHQEEIVDESDFDFQQYPLNIDWKEIEINNRVFHKIYEQYGHFAAALVTSFNQIDKIKFSSYLVFHYTIINYFANLVMNNNLLDLIEFIKCLPKPKGIKEIFTKKFYRKKELSTIKIILDLYELVSIKNKLKIQTSCFNIGDLIDCLDLFYNICTENDIQEINETFTNNRKLYALMSKFNIL